MTRPFFSICIAAYNAQRYICDCLKSIAEQDFRDFEVIVVDDGSAEPLVLTCDAYATMPSITLRRTENGGPYAARQAAFDIASGEVILCADADDGLCDPSVLTKVKRAFDAGADIVLFNATSSERNPALMLDFSALGEDGPVEEDLVWDLFTKDFLLNSLWCKAFKRTLYTKGETKRPRLVMAEDRLQSLEIMSRARSYWLIDEPLYFYRPNPASTTNAGYNPDYFAQACYVEEEVSLSWKGAACRSAAGRATSFHIPQVLFWACGTTAALTSMTVGVHMPPLGANISWSSPRSIVVSVRFLKWTRCVSGFCLTTGMRRWTQVCCLGGLDLGLSG